MPLQINIKILVIFKFKKVSTLYAPNKFLDQAIKKTGKKVNVSL